MLFPFSAGDRVGLASLAGPFGIDALVKIDPQNSGKEGDRRRKRQEQHGGPEDDSRNPPPSQKPQQRGDWRHDRNPQDVTDVHGSQKIARFPFELEVTDGTALAHLRESAEDGIVKDSAHTAAGTALLKNASQR